MNSDNKSQYLIKKKLEDKEERLKDIDEEEVNNLIRSSALLVGLEAAKESVIKLLLAQKEKKKSEKEKEKERIKSEKKSEYRSDLYRPEPIAGWRFPRKFTKLSDSQVKEIRMVYKVDVDGEEVPNPINDFSAMRFPEPVIAALAEKGIHYPTAIQMQGLPVVLSGRDMMGISFTGTGKSLVFLLPALMMALEEESKLSISSNDGPFGIIIVPSRELAVQLHETLNYFISRLLRVNVGNKVNYPMIRSVLCIGGVDIRLQIEEIQRGCHIVIGTPGRLSDLMDKRKVDTMQCRYLVLDEADRLLDMGFDEEIRKVLERFTQPHQTLIFSSTMPKRIQEYAKHCLFNPVVINIGRAGSTNLNVTQDVEFVKDESKLIQILDTLEKTPPPVLIFCENKNDVDEIHEYLLLKGVDVCSMHGDKDQEERNQAIREFRSGLKDVLVATDIVSKGLDFPDVEHVINYDMPKEIENYVLRIGRTGRLGKPGLTTTYVNRNQDEAILLDLKHLLIECGQKIPPFLLTLHEEDPSLANQECSFCGVLGHRLNQCHKLENQRMKALLSGKLPGMVKTNGGMLTGISAG